MNNVKIKEKSTQDSIKEKAIETKESVNTSQLQPKMLMDQTLQSQVADCLIGSKPKTQHSAFYQKDPSQPKTHTTKS
jgi:Flp pilus assembly protein TadG